MSVRRKLMLGFFLLAAMVLIVAALSLRSLHRSNARFANYLDGVSLRERLANEIGSAASRRAIAARNLVLALQTDDRELETAAVRRADADMRSALARLQQAAGPASDAGDEDQTMIAAIVKIESRYGPVAQEIVALALAGQREQAIAKMLTECRPLLAALSNSTANYIAYGQAKARRQAEASADAYAADLVVLIGAGVAATLAAVAMGWLISHGVTVPLQRALRLAEAVAAGDLSGEIVVDRHDETGMLLAALKRMTESLSVMVGRVRQSADGIATASAQISTGNLDLSRRTEEQAGALQQTASSMQEMTATVQQNAESSRQASELASAAAEVAGQGGQVVARVVATMGEISASSKKIADIIGVIDGIAFQTNILALNAAVEAARAGEQGRGFAVVASEVRGLAQRSAQAAREIKDLIGHSVQKVDAGGRLVGEAGETMEMLVSRVRRMTELMAGINASTAEQSTGIVRVNQAVASIEQGTQQNAALVEESAAAASGLEQQAAGLLEVIAAFKTEREERAVA